MLTADLVQARLYRGTIRPGYVKPQAPQYLERAAILVSLFTAHMGSPRRRLEAEIKAIPTPPARLRLHRGLAKLLWDRCTIGTDCPVEPAVLRRDLFKRAAARYKDAGLRQELSALRQEIIDEVSETHAAAEEDLERWLYADLKDEQVIVAFDSLDPEELLSRYNVALAQGVLLRATELTLTLGDQDSRALRELFRRIKFHRLLFRLTKANDGYRILLDGPVSLFRSSQRYGFQMAAFLPTLLHLKGWELEATLKWTRGRTAFFQLSPANGLQPFGHLPAQWIPRELDGLLRQLSRLKGPWRARAYNEILELGGQVAVFPDLVLEHSATGARVFVEVFGYWRSGSIEDRLRLLRRTDAPPLLLALGRHMACDAEELEETSPHVYRFRRTPVAKELIAVAERLLPKDG